MKARGGSSPLDRMPALDPRVRGPGPVPATVDASARLQMSGNVAATWAYVLGWLTGLIFSSHRQAPLRVVPRRPIDGGFRRAPHPLSGPPFLDSV